MTELRTERLLLRPATLEDVPALHRVFSDARAMAYWGTLPHTEIAETRGFVQGMMGLAYAAGEDFVVVFEGRVVGKAGLWRLPEIGFILHPEVWRRGLAREAVSALAEYGFGTRGLTEITADVDPRNQASIGLLEGLGFVETGREARTIQVGDDWCDSVYYALRAQARAPAP